MSNDRFTHSVSQQLKLALSGQTLYYSVCDKNNQLISVGEKYLPDGKSLQDLFDRDEVLSAIYSKSQLMVLSPKFVHVPEHYARHDHNYELFKLTNKSAPDERLFRDHSLEQKEIQYSGNREFVRLIQNKFPNISKTHLSAFLHEQAGKLTSGFTNHIQLFLDGEYLFLTASKNAEVQLSNAYHVVNSEELFYFCMLCMEQLKMEPKSTELYLYHTEFKNQDVEAMFKNYFQQITVGPQASKGLMHIWNACE